MFCPNEFETKYRHHFAESASLPAQDVADWLMKHLQQEEYNDTKAIQDDLHDAQFSDIKHELQSKFQEQMTEKEVDEVFSFLRDEIFPIHIESDSQLNTAKPTGSSITFGFGHSGLDMGLKSPDHGLGELFDKEVLGGDTSDSLRRSSAFHSSQGSMDNHMANMMMGTLANLKLPKQKTNKNDSDSDDPFDLLERKPSQREIAEEKRQKDPYASNKEPFPEFMNVALFSRSDDEYLVCDVPFSSIPSVIAHPSAIYRSV